MGPRIILLVMELEQPINSSVLHPLTSFSHPLSLPRRVRCVLLLLLVVNLARILLCRLSCLCFVVVFPPPAPTPAPNTDADTNPLSLSQVQRAMERILYIWAIRHPASGYVQGINDLATPLYVVFLSAHVGK